MRPFAGPHFRCLRISHMHRFSLLFVSCYLLTAMRAFGQASPLQIVMDGREEAENSSLTEAGMTTLAQSTANVVLYVCGFLAILFTAIGLWELYNASDEQAMYGSNVPTKGSAIQKLIIAWLISIPAIIAAIVPYAVLPEAG